MLATLPILMLIAMLAKLGLAFVSSLDMLLAIYIIDHILLSFNLRKRQQVLHASVAVPGGRLLA
jgi:hypothetical protein